MRQKRTCPPGAELALFVEGGDEERMVQRVGPAVPTFIVPFHGRAKLAELARAASNDPGWPQISRVGVVLDAEEDPVAAWTLVGEVFAALPLPVPAAHGAVEVHGSWTVGGFLLPDGVRPGSSESLLFETAEAAVRGCVDGFFVCTANPGTTAALRDKSRVWAMAAGSVSGGRPDALWSGVDPTHPALQPLRKFLHQVAGLPLP